MKTRTYLDVRFDVTDLNEDERSRLAMEVAVQHESTDADSYRDLETGKEVYVPGKPDVPYPEIEWNEVEDEDDLDSNMVRADLLRIASQLAADTDSDEAQGQAADLLAAERWIEHFDFSAHGGPSPALRDHAASKTSQKPTAPAASEEGPTTSFVLTVCLNGIPEGRDYNAMEETIDATGEAMSRYDEEPEKIVTLLLSRDDEELRGGQKPRFLDARGAAHILFGDQIDDLDFDAHTAQFRSGSDVCASLAAHFNLTDDEYKSLRRS